MSVHHHTLSNGFQVITENMPGLKSASLGIWISGLILEFVDFPTAVDAIEVTPESSRSLVMVAICVFLVFYPLALFCLSRFSIDRAEHESDLDQLRSR